jgi:signal transduction histidine kinase/ActR/RegA family two-component response regulator
LRRTSLATRLVMLLLISILPALAIQAYNEYALRQSREDDIHQRVVQITKQFGEEMGELREGARQLLVALGQLPAVQAHDGAACSALFASLKRQYENYAMIGAVDAKGQLFCASEPTSYNSVADLTFFERAIVSDGLAVGNYWADPASGEKMIHFAQRFYDESGHPSGVVFTGLDLKWLSEHLKERGLTSTQSILIADRLGNIIARLPNPAALVGKNMRKSHEGIMDGNTAGWEEAAGVDGIARIFGYVPAAMFPKDFFLSAGQEKAEAFAPIHDAAVRGIALIAVGFLLAVCAAWQGTRIFFKRPIGALLAAIGEWRNGNLQARATVGDSSSEIGNLGRDFNEMADALAARDEAQKQAEENLRRLNATLEDRVMQRTNELARANERLRQEMSEREKAQADLVHAQKIEAVGQLTSGIAHDFNNLLTAILGNLDVARRRTQDERLTKPLETATRAGKRGAKLVGDLLAFSRRQRLEPQPVAVNEIIEKIDELLTRSIGTRVVVAKNLADGVLPAMTDAAQLELAVLNLAINARDAMPSGGTLTISTQNVPVGDPRLPAAMQGEFVMVAVSDTGTGMTEEVRSKVFEPFFTTKEIGKGTGLGLSMVYGFVTQCGGTVRIDTSVGNGTTVAMFFPRAQAGKSAARGDAVDNAQPAIATQHSGARVVVVDDDPEVREFAVTALTEAGYVVFGAADAWRALEILDQEGKFALLITDYAMPVVTGIALVNQVHRERPELPTLLMTGLTDVPVNELPPGKRRVLRKPFDIAELIRHAGEAIEAGNLSRDGGDSELFLVA